MANETSVDYNDLKLSDTNDEGKSVLISSSADRPNAFNGYTSGKKSAKDVKEMFDAPFKFVKARFNALLQRLEARDRAVSESIAAQDRKIEAQDAKIVQQNEKVAEVYGAFKSGELKGEKGEKGDPYTLTEEDKAAIVAEVEKSALGDFDAALDAIIAIQNKLLGAISFTIYYDGDGNTVCLEADEGMTWGEWCESEYNTIGAYFSPDSDVLLHDYNGKTHCIYHTLDNETGTFTNVYSVDVIESNHQYLCTDW